MIKYQAIKELHDEKHYPTEKLCAYLKISRSAYYRWLKHPVSESEKKNNKIADKIREIHKEHSDMGYRRIRDELDVHHDINVNDKRVLHICQKICLKCDFHKDKPNGDG